MSAVEGPFPGPTPPTEEEIDARAYLMGIAEPPAPRLAHLVALLGAVEAARRVRSRVDLGPHVGAEVAARRGTDRAARDLAAVRALGGRLLVPGGPGWPETAFAAFARVAPESVAGHAPFGLWARGPVDVAAITDEPLAVAVVGSRAATDYGMHVARDWSARFADEGAAVVSGAALGVDVAAHQGCLAADGTTVAVLACGVERAYPARHARLLDAIADRGLVVSEYGPGAIPARNRFLVRNRIIAALSSGAVVVEAGARSGAQRTATVTGLLMRQVMVVPGPVTSALSVGTNRLARDGDASLVTTAAEVLTDLRRLDDDVRTEPAAPPPPAVPCPLTALSTLAVRVHDALPARAPRSAEGIARESGVDPRAVPGALGELAAAGLVVAAGTRGWRRPA